MYEIMFYLDIYDNIIFKLMTKYAVYSVLLDVSQIYYLYTLHYTR